MKFREHHRAEKVEKMLKRFVPSFRIFSLDDFSREGGTQVRSLSYRTQFFYSPQHLSNVGLDLEQNIAVKCNILTTQFRNISVSQ
jgi:hypothetical protein